MWLRDFLPEYVPNARILTYGYDSTLFKNNSTASIREFSRNFLEALSSARAETEVSWLGSGSDRELIQRLGKNSAYNIYWT